MAEIVRENTRAMSKPEIIDPSGPVDPKTAKSTYGFIFFRDFGGGRDEEIGVFR
jgi:hypothetical protein